MTRIENSQVILEIANKGAEITSFKMKDTGIEYMWQGHADYWAGRNPILFPMVSNTFNKKQVINGKEYFMGNHGIVRNAEFEVESISDNSIIMVTKSNCDTRKVYPFDFTLRVIYTLKHSKVNIRYQIYNNSNSTMPFSFGLHPAFNCPLENHETGDEYYLEFSNTETLKGIYGAFGLNENKIIPCDDQLFVDNPTICFEYPKSSFVQLTNGKHGVIVDIVGYRWLAFWKKSKAPFMCIEPWHGHGDFNETSVSFEKREGTINLEPNYHYETAYSIEIY